MLHCGARGYLKSHRAQRRLREAYFVAIVTPATKQLRKMLAEAELRQRFRFDPQPPTANQERPAMTDVLISAGELADLVTKEPCVIIDTRNPDAYAAGHLPGAVNVHEIFTYLATSTPEGIAELKTKFAEAFGNAGLSGKETAVIYEQSMNSGFGQSCRGYFLLTMLGYPKIKVLHGGFDAWAKPACRSPPTSRRRRRHPSRSCRKRRHPDRCQDHACRDRQTDRAARCARRGRVDRRQLLALRQGFLPAQGPHPGRRLARVVPHDEADLRRTALQVARTRSSPSARPSAFRRARRSISTASRARAPRTRSLR